MLVLPVCGTLRGAGDEKVGRCFEGVLVDGVGVAMFVSGSSELGCAQGVLGDEGRSYRGEVGGNMLCCGFGGRMKARAVSCGEAHASQVLAKLESRRVPTWLLNQKHCSGLCCF
jgi:hypothetical protein